MVDLLAENVVFRAALLLALFLVVVALTFYVMGALNSRRVTRERLLEGSSAPTVSSTGPGRSLRSEAAENAWIKLVNAVEKSGLSLADTEDSVIRERLSAAGYSAPYAPRVFTLIRLALVIILPVLAALMLWSGEGRPSVLKVYITLAVAAALGLYLPKLFIRAKADRRQTQIVNAFPDALDLMLVCVEAGLGLEAAFARVGMEMTKSHPLLAEQFGTTVLELRAGRSREDALRRLADRAGADEIRAFATLLIQSTKLGSSIGTTLRVYASEMRERRRMRAEEKAHRLPVLLSIPLVACMLPAMMGVLMLPAAIRVIRTLLPAMASVS